MMYRTTQRWYLTEDGKRLVPENDPAGRFLYAKVGSEIPEAEARKYGLIRDAVRITAPQAEDGKKRLIGFINPANPEKKQAAQPENKKAKKPLDKTKGTQNKE